jgi:predicted lipid-binding transport protein (Tim44 family)
MKGRPFLGAFSGFLFGLFGGIALFLFGVIPLDSHLLWILPFAGILLGLVMAAWAPFGSGSENQAVPPAAPAPPAASPAVAPTDADDTVVDENPPVNPEQPPAQ